VKEGGSQTAKMVAAFRGQASRVDDPICDDPWADALAGEDGAQIAAQYAEFNPHAMLWMAVRTGFLDQLVRNTDATQIVLLGAGLDTRAARLGRDGVRFFEVDHPSTQATKRARLSELDGYPEQAATYVSCDFETDDPIARLVAEGLDPGAPTLVLWEGVVHYLSEEAIRTTLHRIATGLDPRSLLVFDTVSKLVAQNRSRREMDQELTKLVDDVGEPLRFGLDDAVPLLNDCGFRHVRTVSFDEACLALTGTYERERAFRFQHFVLASPARPFAF
jgi:methyltransferase (TIGR00027 family)